MGSVEKISVAVTPEMAAEMRTVVETGEYASTSEVVRDALREWRLRREERIHARDELGRLWDIGIASGLPVDGEEAFAKLRERLNSRITKRA